jgi:hypothetical protein
VQVHLPLLQWDTLKPILLESRERIHTIISYEGYKFDEILKNAKENGLWAFLESLGPLPNFGRLEDVHRYSSERFNGHRFLSGYSSLKQMVNIPLSAHGIQLAKQRFNMETLVTFEDVETILNIFENIDGLEKVQFCGLYHGKPPLRDVDAKEYEKGGISGHPLGWKELIYDIRDMKAPLSLFSWLRSLTELKLSIHFTSFIKMATTLYQLQNLNVFDLNIDGNIADIPHVPHELFPNPRVSSLRLWVNCIPVGWYINGIESTIDPEALMYNAMEVVTITLLRILPNIKKLLLECYNGGSPAFSLPSLEGIFTGIEL